MGTNPMPQELLLQRPTWIWHVCIRSIKTFNDSSCLHNQECYIQNRKLSERKCPLGRLFLITFKAMANKVYLKCNHHLKGNFRVESICHSIFFHRYSCMCLYCSLFNQELHIWSPGTSLLIFQRRMQMKSLLQLKCNDTNECTLVVPFLTRLSYLAAPVMWWEGD